MSLPCPIAAGLFLAFRVGGQMQTSRGCIVGGPQQGPRQLRAAKVCVHAIPMAGSQSSTAQDVLWRLIAARKPSRLSMPQREPLSRAARNWGRLRQAKDLPIQPSGRKLQQVLRARPPTPPDSLQGSLCQARANYRDTPRLRRPNHPSKGKSGMQPPIEETLRTLPSRAQGRC